MLMGKFNRLITHVFLLCIKSEVIDKQPEKDLHLFRFISDVKLEVVCCLQFF